MPCLEFLLILTNLLRVEEEEGLFELENAEDEDIGKEWWGEEAARNRLLFLRMPGLDW